MEWARCDDPRACAWWEAANRRIGEGDECCGDTCNERCAARRERKKLERSGERVSQLVNGLCGEHCAYDKREVCEGYSDTGDLPIREFQ